MDKIDMGYYLEITIDEYHVPNKFFYQNTHFFHNNLIIGYDNTNGLTYDIVGFTNTREYKQTKITMQEFETAFYSNTDTYMGIKARERIKAYRIKEDVINFIFDIKQVYDFLSDYITSANSAQKCYVYYDPQEGQVFGIDACKCLIANLTRLIDENIMMFIDLRHFHILWEHKKHVLEVIQYLHDNGYITCYDRVYPLYKNIYKQSEVIRNTVLKFISVRNALLVHDAIKKMNAMLEDEVNVLSILLDDIKTVNNL